MSAVRACFASLLGQPRRAGALVASAACAVGAGFFVPVAWCEPLARWVTYPVLLIATVWWASITIGKLAGVRRMPDLRANAWPAILLATGSLLVTTGERHEAKVLYDEYVLGLTALQMHTQRELACTTPMWPLEGDMVGVSDYLDKRPGFFPFAVATLHDLTGYRPDNAIYLNLLLVPVVLWSTYRVGLETTQSRWAGALAVVLLLTLPLLVTTACSGGMDFLNLTLVALGTLLGLRWVRSGAAEDAAAFVLCGVLLIHTRYESGLYAVAIAATLGAGWLRHRCAVLPAAALAAPLLLLPVAWLQRYVGTNPTLWELREGLTSRFSLAYLETNLPAAWRYISAWSPEQTNSVWLAALGAAALATALVRWRALTQALGWNGVPLAVFGLCAGGNIALLQVYYWGALDDWIVARLSLPFWWFLAVAVPIVAATGLGRLGATLPRHLLVASAVAFVVIAYPILAQRRTDHRNWLEAIARWEERQLAATDPQRTLIVANKSSLFYVLRQRPSIGPLRAKLRLDQMAWHLERGAFDAIYVTQHFDGDPSGAHRLATDDDLGPRVVLETVAEERFATTVARISRVVRILPADGAPAEPQSAPPDSTPPGPAPAL